VNEWIDAAPALQAWIAQQPPHNLIGLDTEFMRTDTFRPKLALIQANIGGAIALIDAPQIWNAPDDSSGDALAARLRDPACLCVMHSASEDLEALAAVVPDGPAVLFDTQIAAAMTGLGAGLSYQKLVALLLTIDLPKAETRSDWLQRPLTPAQLEYAAQDVVHLPQLHALLAEKLAALGRSDWLAQDCRRLIERVCRAVPDTQPQRAFRGAADWPRESQALLRRVLLWRDASARTLDKPRPWILDDAHALNLSAQPPRDGNELFERSKGLRALRAAQRQELLAVLQAPLTAEELDITAPIPAALTGAEKRVLASMRDDVAAIAAKLEIPEGLLCPRRHLETLMSDRAWPAALEGWRKPLLHEVLMGRMAAAA
jgi:ribonuclease D